MSLPELPADYFAQPIAEREPWLMQVFSIPEGAEKNQGNNSTIIYGSPGSGKTALRFYWQRNPPPGVLAVPWLPEPTQSVTVSTSHAHTTLRQAIGALLEHLVVQKPLVERLRQAPDWTGTALAWFLRQYLPMEARFYLESRGAEISSDALRWYLALLEKPPTPIFKEDASQNDELRMLMRILNQAQCQSVWWLVDGLEKWPPGSEKYLMAMMEALLSTLAIFDVPQYVFKLFLPYAFKETVQNASGITRSRVDEFELLWTAPSLTRLIEKRLALAIGQDPFTFTDLSEATAFWEWLQQYGSQNPRAWLAWLHPIVEAFQDRNDLLTPDDLQRITRIDPSAPPLRLLVESKEVCIGEEKISLSSEMEFKILAYLYQRPGKICSLEEIYFCALQGMERVPRNGDTGWVHNSIWRPALDTMVYRLRKKIEPQPDQPIYLVTHPRKGLELKHLAL